MIAMISLSLWVMSDRPALPRSALPFPAARAEQLLGLRRRETPVGSSRMMICAPR